MKGELADGGDKTTTDLPAYSVTGVWRLRGAQF